MSEHTHKIKSLVLELELGASNQASRIQDKVAQTCQKKLVPLLENYLDRLDSPHTIYRLERLELDIGEIRQDNIDTDFMNKIKKMLWRELERQIPVNAVPVDGPDFFKPAASQRAAQTLSRLELLDHFICNGFLPWWADKITRKELNAYLEDLTESASPALKTFITRTLRIELRLNRLVHQFSDESLTKTIGLFSVRYQNMVSEYCLDCISVLNALSNYKGFARKDGRRIFWQKVLRLLPSAELSEYEPSDFIEQIFPDQTPRKQKDDRAAPAKEIIEACNSLLSSGFEFKSDLPVLLEKIGYKRDKKAPEKLFSAQLYSFVLDFHQDMSRILAEIKADLPMSPDCTSLESWRRELLNIPLRGNFKTDRLRITYEILLFLGENMSSDPVVLLDLFTDTISELSKSGMQFTSELPKIFHELKYRFTSSPDRKKALKETLRPDDKAGQSRDGSHLKKTKPRDLAGESKITQPETIQSPKANKKELKLDESSAAEIKKPGLEEYPEKPELFDSLEDKDQNSELKPGPDNKPDNKYDKKETLSEIQKLESESGQDEEIHSYAAELKKPGLEEYPEKPELSDNSEESGRKSELKPDDSDNSEESGRKSELKPDDKNDKDDKNALQNLIKIQKSKSGFSQAEEIYISNSGLVLVWVFLPHFFEHIGLVHKKQFIDLAAARRAALLLQYLTDEETAIAEYSLPLNKLLCDLDSDESFDTNLEITEDEKTECHNLLEAVIQNWTIIKNTSVAGFRQAFLVRNGVLSFNKNNWILRVEKETYDVVLDKLPWTINVVKLPWMSDILYVEWS